ncbi:MAG: cell wall hydrolase [Pseudomonadota bacterium]
MTTHGSSIPEAHRGKAFTPPPAIVLTRARAAQTEAENAPQHAEPQETTPSLTERSPTTPTMRKRLAALLAVIAVPAMAAPGDFGAMAGDAAAEHSPSEVNAAFQTAQPFEKPGMSFPGSAFYYLADPPKAALIALPEADPLERGAAGGRAIGARIDAGPAASAFFAGSGGNFARASDCLAQAIWYEAASESEAGQRAVAQVVLNRVSHPSWPSSVCGVVYEGSSRITGCQFSFTCDGSLARRPVSSLKGRGWERARTIAANALSGDVYAPIGHATHYHTLWVDPYWAGSLDPVGTIGAHRFYRNRGSAGAKAAFSDRYSGSEPMVARAGAVNSAIVQANPAASNGAAPRLTIEGNLTDQGTPEATLASPLNGTSLIAASPKKSGQTRRKYAQAGRWKVDPATLNPRDKPADQTAEDAPTKPPATPEEGEGSQAVTP